MDYYKLVAVTGLPGLYELVSSQKNGAIVRSLQDNSTKFASARLHQFSHLESIEIYTSGDNVNLIEIFTAMDKESADLPDAKDDKAVKDYFKKVYPEMDFDRVYSSDMKKMVKWFSILKEKGIELKLSEPEQTEEIETAKTADIIETAQQEEAAPKKTAAKKTAKKPVEEAGSSESKKLPAKKAAPKKAATKKAEKNNSKD